MTYQEQCEIWKKRERMIMLLHQQGLSLRQIGEKFKVSNTRIWQIIKRIKYAQAS